MHVVRAIASTPLGDAFFLTLSSGMSSSTTTPSIASAVRSIRAGSTIRHRPERFTNIGGGSNGAGIRRRSKRDKRTTDRS